VVHDGVLDAVHRVVPEQNESVAGLVHPAAGARATGPGDIAGSRMQFRGDDIEPAAVAVADHDLGCASLEAALHAGVDVGG